MSDFSVPQNFDWDKFAADLNDQLGEGLIDDGDVDNPLDYWLQDVTVADVIDFLKKYTQTKD